MPIVKIQDDGDGYFGKTFAYLRSGKT